MAKKRIGRQTPTQSYTPPSRKSLYKEAVELYNRSGRKAQKWQKTKIQVLTQLNNNDNITDVKRKRIEVVITGLTRNARWLWPFSPLKILDL